MKRFSQIEAELKRLAGDAVSNLYRRLELATQLVKSDEWLAQHDGSLDKAEEYLADLYFADLRGLIAFSTLRAMFEKFEKSEWEKNRFDIRAMEIMYRDSTKQEAEPRPKRGYKEDYEKVVDELTETKAVLATERRMADQTRKESQTLQERVRELERENAELRGRIQELERLANRQLAAV